MTDEEIDTSEVPPLDDSFFARATLRLPQRALVPVTLNVDPLLLRWFERQGADSERLINAALRLYVEAHAAYQPAGR